MAHAVAEVPGAQAPGPLASDIIETDVPARLDRLPWSRFHVLVIGVLGITWILDGLEVTLVGSLSGVLTQSGLALTSAQIGLAASAYLLGAVSGALLFGFWADRFGRKRLFTVTVLVYGAATAATGMSWNFWSFALCRFLTGAGIGGEYSAINSAIHELIPARHRGWVDLAVNGSFWVGAAVGAVGALFIGHVGLPTDVGWRLLFLLGGVLALLITVLRRHLPESPRWLMTHGRLPEADRVVTGIEQRVERETGCGLLPVDTSIRLRGSHRITLGEIARTLTQHYARRSVLGLTLMASQAFLYNAIFFTYGLILTDFYGVPAGDIGWYILPFAAGNFLGPLLLGSLFDRIGRKPMIAATYAISGVLMLVTGLLFRAGAVDATTQTALWTINFFFASAAASSAYLTVSEGFPLELRALAIAIFYALGTAVGGAIGPALFGALIASHSRSEIMWGYALGAVLMLGAAVLEAWIGVAAERKPLESVARPLSCPD